MRIFTLVLLFFAVFALPSWASEREGKNTKFELIKLSEFDQRDVSGYLASEKLDGVRAYWDGENLLSRSGKKINAPKNFTLNFPSFALDGELYTKRGEFEKIQSIVMDKNPDEKAWQEIKFYVFDAPSSEKGLLKRLEKLENFLSKNELSGEKIKIIKQIKLRDNTHLEEILDEIIALGGEGVVVRKPNLAYHHGRSKNDMKYKKFKDAECEVVSLNEGSGKLKGKLGSVTCETSDKKRFKIGSGFSDEERINPPKIGEVITYKFQNLTANGLPRFPVFVRARRD